MALEARPFFSTLQLVYDMGTDQDGRPVTRRRSFSNVKNDALEQDVYDVANAIAGLSENPLKQILVLDKTELVNV